MDLKKLAAQYGGKAIESVEPIETDVSRLAAKFGGVPVAQEKPEVAPAPDTAALAAKFGGIPITKETTEAPVSKTNIFGERNVEGIMGVPSVTPTPKPTVAGVDVAGIVPSQQGFAQPNLQEMGVETDPDRQIINAMIGPNAARSTAANDKAQQIAEQRLAYAKDQAQRAIRSGASQEEATEIFANSITPVSTVSSAGKVHYPDTFLAMSRNAVARMAAQGTAVNKQALALAADLIGSDEYAEEMLKSAEESQLNAMDYPARIRRINEVQSIKDAAARAYEGTIENAGFMLQSMSAAGAAKLLAQRGVKELSKNMSKEAAEALLEKANKYAAMGGAYLSSAGMESGSIYGDIYKETGKRAPGTALAFGSVAAVLDAYIPGKVMTGPARDAFAREIAKTASERYGKDVLAAYGIEGVTEAIQTMIEKGALTFVDGRPLFTKENLLDALDAAYVGGGVGAAVQAGSQAVQDIGLARKGVDRTAVRDSLLQDQMATEQANLARESALEAWKTRGLTQRSKPAQEMIVPSIDEAVKKYIALGQTKENALRLARQDIADQQEAEDARRIDSGVAGDSTQISGEPIAEPPAEGTEQLVGPTVDGVGVTAGPVEEGTVEQPAALEEIDQTRQNFEDFLGKTFKLQLMEAKGQDILDSLEESNTSPKDVATKFWNETYFSLPAAVQERFNKELQAQTGMQPGSVLSVDANGNQIRAESWQDIADLVVADMADTVGYLEGTERGFTVLMDEANRRSAGQKTQEGVEEQQAPLLPQEIVEEQPIAEEIEQDETLPHVVEAKQIAAKLRRLDPYNNYVDILNDPLVTTEDVAQGRATLAEYEPASTIPTPIAPDDESASIESVNSALSGLVSPKQLKANPPVVVNDYADLPVSDDIKRQAEEGGVKAFVDPSTNKAYYIASQIPKNEIKGTILHEQGGHIGLPNLIGAPKVAKLANQVLAWSEGGTELENVIAKEAVGMANVSGEAPDSERYQQEVVAYFTEIAVNRYGIDPLKAQPKEKQKVTAWLKELWREVLLSLRKLNVDPSTLTAEDIVRIVQGAARVGTSKVETAESKAVFTPEMIDMLANEIADSPAVTKEIYETDELGKKPKILASAKDLNASLGFTKPGIDKTFTEIFYDEIKTLPQFKAGDKKGAILTFINQMESKYPTPVGAVISPARVLAQLPPLNLYNLNTAEYSVRNVYRNPSEAARRYSESTNSYRQSFFRNAMSEIGNHVGDTKAYTKLYDIDSQEEKQKKYNTFHKGIILMRQAIAKYAMAGNKLLPITEKNEYLPLNGEDITPEFIDSMLEKLNEGASPKQALNDAFMTTIFPQRNGIIKSQVGQDETGWLFFSGEDSANALRLVTADTGSEPGSWCVGRSSNHGRSYLRDNNFSIYVQNGKSLVASLDDLSDGQPTRWFGLGAGQSVLPSHKYLLEEHPNLAQAPVVVLSPEEQLEADEEKKEDEEIKEGYELAERLISEAATGDVRALSIVYDALNYKQITPVTRAVLRSLSDENAFAVEKITGYSPAMFAAFDKIKDETDQAINNLTISDVVPELDELKDYNGNIRFEVPVINTSVLANPNNPDTQMVLAPIAKLINAYSLENELPLRGDINTIIKRYVISNGMYSSGSGFSNSFINYLEELIKLAGAQRRDSLEEALKLGGALSEDEISARMRNIREKFYEDREIAFRPILEWSRNAPQESFIADFSPSTTPAEAYSMNLSYHMPGHPSVYGTSDDYSISEIVNEIKQQYNLPKTKSLYSLKNAKEDEIKTLSKYEFIGEVRGLVPNEKVKALPKSYYEQNSQWEEELKNVPYDIPGVRAMLEGKAAPEGEAPKILASKKIDKILLKIERSESPEEMGGLLGQLMEADSWDDKKRVLNSIWNTLDSKSVATLLPALTTSQITDWVGDKIPHLNQVNRLVERMSVMRSKMLAAIDETAVPWANFAKTHIAGGKRLTRLMHYSTLAEVDPSLHANAATAIAKDSQLAELRKLMDAASNPRAKAAYKGQITARTDRINTAYKLWNEAGKVGKGEAHGIYTKVRDHYSAIFKLHRAILDERIAKSSLSGDIDDETTPKGMLMAAIRKTYEAAKTVGVYFPLMRYGNYWMSLGKGLNKEFYMFESELQRNRFLDIRVAQLQKAGDNRTYDEIMESGELDAGNDLTKLRNLTTESSEMLQGIFKIIDTQNVTDKEALKDAVYQMYLLTMPEQSFRKQFIHRKGTTGFSGDALRNFVRSGYASANQLTRLQFGPDITTEMDSAFASLEGMPPKDKIKLSQFLNEVGTRVGEELAPSNEDEFAVRFANGVNQAAFFFRLTSIKSAIANMTAIPIFGFPVLASKYGVVNAAAALAKYTNVFNHTTFVKPDGSYTPLSVGFSKHVQSNSVLTAAFDEAAERGVTEITRTYDLMAMARTPSAAHQGTIRRGTRAFVNFTGLLFHHSERLNREIMFMTTFELDYKKGLSEGLSGGINGEAFARAIDAAVKITYDSMFNYTKYNRPRIMRPAPARIVFQFKLFPQQVSAYLIRNFAAMIKGSDLNPRARREAATQLIGTLMMTGMFAGITGLPLYYSIIAVAQGLRDALHDEDDDPIPIEERDLDLWFRNVWLPKHFGEAAKFFEKGPVATITNADIASSTSLSNLWFRDTKYDHSMANQFNDFIIGALGPGASLITDGIKAVDDFNSGHFNQGVEKLLPAFAKGAFTQWAWGQEGIKVKGSQAEIFSKDEVTKMMRLWKAFGFNPTELTRIQETNYPAMELIKRAQDERNAIMNRLNLELVREDDEAFEEALVKASKFTEANPEMAIKPDTIVDSALKRAKLRAMADRGLIVPPKLMPRMYEFVHASRPKTDKERDQAAFDALIESAKTTPAEGEE